MKVVEKIAHILYLVNCSRKPSLILDNVEDAKCIEEKRWPVVV